MSISVAIRSTLLSAIFLIPGVISVAAQEAIDQAGFEKVIEASSNVLEREAYRVKTVSEKYDHRGQPPVLREESVGESLPTGRSRLVSTTSKNGVVETNETIWIGQRGWHRVGGGLWEPKQQEMGSGLSVYDQVTGTSYRIVDRAKIGSESVTVYERVQKIDHIDGGTVTLREVATQKYWITEEGRLLKTVRDVDTVGWPDRLEHTTSEYEYKPVGIVIRAPTVGK
ncbi:MAG: hypothetical protein ABI878_11860 [Acidobacteriota bacterium]